MFRQTLQKRVLFVRILMPLVLAVLGVFFVTLAWPAQHTLAASDSTINFQGRLLTNTGAVVPDGNYNLEFKIYDQSGTSGSAQGTCTGDVHCLWFETRTSGNVVRVANGYFTVNLGSVHAFSTATAPVNWDQDLYLGMNVGGIGTPSWDGEMTPQIHMTAVPYAFRAGQLASLAGSNTAVLQFASSFAQVSTITLPDPGASTATVCYQTASACGFAAGSGTAFLQGGNSFSGTTAGTLGTMNNGNLNFITDNAIGLILDTSGNLSFNQASTLGVSTIGTANAAGFNLTLSAGAANGSTTGAAGGVLAIFGGAAAGSGNNNGGKVKINGGAPTGSGNPGNLLLQTTGGQIGIGTSTPAFTVDVQADAASANVFATGYGANNGGVFVGRAANGTQASPTNSVTGDNLAIFGAGGYGTSAFSNIRGSIAIQAADNWSNTDQGTRIVFNTTQNGGTTKSERLRITDTGNIGINTAGFGSPTAQLQVQGTATSSGAITMTPNAPTSSNFTTSSSITINAGDYIVPTTGANAAQARQVISGGTGTAFVVSPAFTASFTDTFTIYRAITNLTTDTGTSALFVQGGTGAVGIGSGIPSALLSVGSTNQFTVDGSGDLTAAGTATIQGSNALTLGKASTNTGAIVFQGSGGVGTLTLKGPTTPNTGNFTLTIPTITANDTVCVATLANCAAAGTPSGDLTGTYPGPTIAKLQGGTLTITSVASGQVLNYNGSVWVNTGSPTLSGTVTVAAGQSYTGAGALSLTSGGANALTLDTGGAAALNIGAASAATNQINLNQSTQVLGGKSLTLASGTGQFSQTYTGTSDAHTITANSLTTGTALKVTSSNNTAANTAWDGLQFNLTNAQGTTAVSSGSIFGADFEFNQNATVAGNTESVANFAIAANSGSPADSTVTSILNVANNDTATGNQIVASSGLLINGANVTNGINLSGTFGTNLITSNSFNVAQGGAVSGITTLGLSGNLTQSGANSITSGTNGYLINGGSNTAGHYLRNNGASYVDNTIQASDLPSLTGTYLRNIPTATGDNTIQPATSSVVALTVNGTNTGTAATAVNIVQTGAAGDLTLSNTAATSGNLIALTQSTSAYTGTALLLNLASGSGSFASGNFIDLQTNGASKFAVNSAGTVTLAAGQAYTGAGALSLTSGGATNLTIDTGGAATLNIGAASATTVNFAQAASAINLGAVGGTTITPGGNLTIAESNTNSTTITSDLTAGARSTYALNISQANNATNANTAGLLQLTNLDADSTAALLNISQVSGGNGINIGNVGNSGVDIVLGQTGGVGISELTLTSGTGLKVQGLTSGIGLSANLNANAETTASGVAITGNAGGITADYTGSFISVNPTRTLTAAATRNDSGNYLSLVRANTVNNASGIFNITGALATLSSTCTQTAGTCNDSSNILSLSQSYTNATGTVLNVQGVGTGNLAALSTTNASANGVSIGVQSNSSSQYALQVTSNNGSTNDLYVRADGNVGIGTSSPSALLSVGSGSAFQVSTTGAVTAGGGVTIGTGTTGDTTGILLTLDSKSNNSTDPTEVNGALYYNSSTGNFRCGVSGAWENCIGGLMGSNTAASSAVTGCTTACSSFSVSGTSIPANYCQAGRVIHVIANGVYSTTASTFQMGLYYGTNASTQTSDTLIGAATPLSASISSASNWGWSLDYTIICFSTTSMNGQGVFTYQTSGTASTADVAKVVGTNSNTTVTTTSNANLYLFPTFGTSSGSSITAEQFIVTGE